MDKDVFIIIDGNSLMHRAFYALPSFTNKDGLHTNVIYGFVNMLNKLIEEVKPKYMAIAFDTKAPTFRHKEYVDYKAKRQKTPRELVEQIPYLKQVIDAMNISRVELDGYEADDIIGTLSKTSDEENIKTFIVTGDRDAFQLISTNVHVLITRKGISETEEYDEERLFAQYRVTPEQVVDLKGLMGDSSDNIPGVPGIGEKTALKLLKQFGTMDNTFENISDIKGKRARESLKENKDMALMSKHLATILRDVPIDTQIDKYLFEEPDSEKLIELYRELDFRSFLEKMDWGGRKDRLKEKIEYSLIDNHSDMMKLYDDIREVGGFAFKFSIDENDIIDFLYLSFNNKQFCIVVKDPLISILKSMFENESIFKAGHNLKEDIMLLKTIDINIKAIKFDSMIGAYLLNPSHYNYRLKDIYKEYLYGDILDYEDTKEDKHDRYSSSVAAIEELIKPIEDKVVQRGMDRLFHGIELPLIEVLADMEYNGFKIDIERLEELSESFNNRIEDLTQAIHTDAGEEFNINSTKQLSHILFDKLKLPPIKKTKTGYSTDVEVLERLFDKHIIIEKILSYRQLLKIKSTYVDGLLNLVNPETGKIHSKFNQTSTTTGRLSSTEPNLQNIPIKTEDGREIRKVFVTTDKDYVLIDADYSQIELRVLAHISQDETLIESFKNNHDIHKKTAAEVFGVSTDMVTSLMRNRAKAVNFGIIYGISDYGLSKDLKITRKEAKLYIDSYFKRYPKVKEYMEDIVTQGKEKGYVTTILNRIRYIPELSSPNAIKRNFGERMAMNTPIQGSAADIIKIAMVGVYKELKDNKMKSKLILQVHDELVIETHKNEIEEVKKILKEKMEKAVSLCVPLVADIKMGDSWFDVK